jgi:hypothetical protein
MAYTLQALIATESAIKATLSDCGVVRLPQGYAMVPISRRIRETHGIPFLPLTNESLNQVPTGIAALAETVLREDRAAYVEAEFFGGDGTQGCVMWDGGGESKLLVNPGAINIALRFLGVEVGDEHDEFDALGFGRFRDTEQWGEIAK